MWFLFCIYTETDFDFNFMQHDPCYTPPPPSDIIETYVEHAWENQVHNNNLSIVSIVI